MRDAIKCLLAVVAKLSQLQRRDNALCELTRLLVSDFFVDHTGDYLATTPSCRQVVVRVCCFLRFCIKPMRYIYHPQLDCYLVVVNSDCSRPCELTLRPLECDQSRLSNARRTEWNFTATIKYRGRMIRETGDILSLRLNICRYVVFSYFTSIL